MQLEYTLKEIAKYLDIHYTIVNRAAKKNRRKGNNVALQL